MADWNAVPRRAQLGIRIAAADAGPLTATLGVAALPGAGQRLAWTGGDLLWLGPTEYLLLGSFAERSEWKGAVSAGVGDRGAVIDLSASRLEFELSGPGCREVLRASTAIDTDPSIFGVGQVASTLVARIPAVIFPVDDRPGYRILVRPSFASYLTDWMTDAIRGVAGLARVTDR